MELTMMDHDYLFRNLYWIAQKDREELKQIPQKVWELLNEIDFLRPSMGPHEDKTQGFWLPFIIEYLNLGLKKKLVTDWVLSKPTYFKSDKPKENSLLHHIIQRDKLEFIPVENFKLKTLLSGEENECPFKEINELINKLNALSYLNRAIGIKELLKEKKEIVELFKEKLKLVPILEKEIKEEELKEQLLTTISEEIGRAHV